ncbi:MAG: FAD-dependent oxidoreductase [Cyanobacteria bacterium J06642_9]
MQIQQHNGLLEKAAFTRPNHRETVFCHFLVVGESVAAYAATLSALQAGASVCLVQSSKIVAKPWVTQANLTADDNRLIKRPSFWKQITGEDFAISRRYKQLRDRHRSLAQRLQTQSKAIAKPLTVALATALNEALLPYLNSGKLMLIPNAVPVMVLTAASHGKPQHLVQVIFRNTKTKARFTVHSKLTLDGTPAAGLPKLAQLSSKTQCITPLNPFHLAQSSLLSRQARGTLFAHSVGIAYVDDLGLQRSPGQSTGNALQNLLKALFSSSEHPLPFTLPLGALITPQIEGLILSPATLGITEGLTGLGQYQPIQWAWGEAAGHLAAIAIDQNIDLLDFGQDASAIHRLQRQLVRHGVPLYWFDDVSHNDPDFEAIQFMAIKCIVRTASDRDLHFRPENLVSRAVLATALVNFWDGDHLNPKTATFADVTHHHWAYTAVETACVNGWMQGNTPKEFLPSRVLNRHQCYQILQRIAPTAVDLVFAQTPVDSESLSRRDLARVMYGLYLT